MVTICIYMRRSKPGGTSSQIADASSTVQVTSQTSADALGVTPSARVVVPPIIGSDRVRMGPDARRPAPARPRAWRGSKGPTLLRMYRFADPAAATIEERNEQ
jgi:hypothetical protein